MQFYVHQISQLLIAKYLLAIGIFEFTVEFFFHGTNEIFSYLSERSKFLQTIC